MTVPTGETAAVQRDHLYDLLPAVYRRLDEPSADERDKGQLRLFMRALETALDVLRDRAEGMRLLHDVLRGDPEAVVALGRWIGWSVEPNSPLGRQRRDVLDAFASYAVLGTATALHRASRRATGEPGRIVEYRNNVLFTNAPENDGRREIYTRAINLGDDSGWSAAECVAATPGVDGRPAVVYVSEPRDIAGRWLFMHSDRGGERRIWRWRPGDAFPRPVDAHVAESARAWVHGAGESWTEESPAVALHDGDLWLAWSSDRGGSRQIWVSRFDRHRPGPAYPVSGSVEGDCRSPTLVSRGASSELCLAWHVEGAGASRLWCSSYSGTKWSVPAPMKEDVTSRGERDGAAGAERSPALAVDGQGAVRVAWTAQRGSGSVIRHATLSGETRMGTSDVTGTEGGRLPRVLDEDPAMVWWKDGLVLVWSSSRTGRWRLYGCASNDRSRWTSPVAVTGPDADDVSPPLGDVEPALLPDRGDGAEAGPQLFWASARGASAAWSTTVDVGHLVVRRAMGTRTDCCHYLWDARAAVGARTDARYAGGTVGLWLPPDSASVSGDQVDAAQVAVALRSIVPATVSLHGMTDPDAHVHLAAVSRSVWCDAFLEEGTS